MLAQLGRYREARASLLAAVEQLPSQFSAWNDLGYVEDRLGRPAAAVSDFRHAVGADSRYALGWFNLGVELERQGLLHAFAAQGAFGRAIAVEPSLSTRSHRLSLDNHVYITNLDISKPLPPNWSFTTIEKRPLAGSLGLVLLLVAALQLGRALTGGQGGGAKAAEWLLQATQTLSRRLPGHGALAPAAVAVASTLLVFLLALLRSGAANLVEVTLLLLGVGAIIAAIWRSRVLVARRREIALTQRGWPPAIAVSMVAAVLGIAWAPLPVASADGDAAAAVHWIGPVDRHRDRARAVDPQHVAARTDRANARRRRAGDGGLHANPDQAARRRRRHRRQGKRRRRRPRAARRRAVPAARAPVGQSQGATSAARAPAGRSEPRAASSTRTLRADAACAVWPRPRRGPPPGRPR